MITGLVDYKITGLRLKDWNEGEGWGFEMITEQKGGLAAESRKGQKKKRPAVICEPLEDEATTYSSTI